MSDFYNVYPKGLLSTELTTFIRYTNNDRTDMKLPKTLFSPMGPLPLCGIIVAPEVVDGTEGKLLLLAGFIVVSLVLHLTLGSQCNYTCCNYKIPPFFMLNNNIFVTSPIRNLPVTCNTLLQITCLLHKINYVTVFLRLCLDA